MLIEYNCLSPQRHVASDPQLWTAAAAILNILYHHPIMGPLHLQHHPRICGHL